MSVLSTHLLPTGLEGSLPPPDDRLIESNPRWKLVMRVVGSPLFANSSMLSKFLLFVCEQTLLNHLEELTERNIGVVVFQRRPDYKTSEDNIVRSYVRQLRQRLERYFEEHQDEPLQILIPRGGYFAVFQERQAVEAGPLPGISASARQTSLPSPRPRSTSHFAVGQKIAPGTLPAATPAVRSKRLLMAMCLLVGLLAGIAGSLLAPALFAPVSPAHEIWTMIFTPSSETRIVTADSALATLQELSGKHATLQDYVNGNYFSQFNNADTNENRKLQRLGRERLTGFPDISTVAEIMGLPEIKHGHVSIRSARSFTIEDAKDANLILLGSSDSTPWVSLFEPRMNFRFVFDQSVYSSYFANTKPQPGEQSTYRNTSVAPPYFTYAVLAFLPNLDDSNRVLIVEGLTTAGTEAASRFLLHGDIAAFLNTVPHDKSGIRPFELLLKTTNMDSNSGSVEIVARRIY